jgi:hypothetical protein
MLTRVQILYLATGHARRDRFPTVRSPNDHKRYGVSFPGLTVLFSLAFKLARQFPCESAVLLPGCGCAPLETSLPGLPLLSPGTPLMLSGAIRSSNSTISKRDMIESPIEC